MAEAVIVGYFGSGNLGDETNLRELIFFLRKNYPRLQISVLTADPAETAERYGVRTIGRFNFKLIGLALKRADFLICGGGSLFQDQTSLRSLFYYTWLIILAKYYQLKVVLYGQGIGPINSQLGKWITRYALSKADLIMVRDRLSVITLGDLRVRKHEIFLTGEPLLAIPALTREEVALYWKNRKSAIRVGFILKQDRRMKEFWKQLLANLKWKKNLEIYMVVIDKRDQEYNMELASDCGADLIIETADWHHCQQIIGEMELVISMRLHGLVLGVLQGTPCCGLSTDPKIDGFCLQLGIPFIQFTYGLDQVTFLNRIMNMLSESKIKNPNWIGKEQEWQASALENQSILSGYLREFHT